MSERMSLLEFLKERSGIRLSKLEAYLDLVDKASVQYIPKDLCKQEFSLSNGHKGCGHDAALAANQLEELGGVCQDAGIGTAPLSAPSSSSWRR